MEEYRLISRYLVTAIGRLELVKSKLLNDDLPIRLSESVRNDGKNPDRLTVQLSIVENQIKDLELLIKEISEIQLLETDK